MVDASVSLARRRPAFGSAERRRAALMAGSIVFHVAILMPLALRWFEPTAAQAVQDVDLPIFLQIEPRPLLPGETARPVAAAASTEATPTVGDLRAGAALAPAAPGQARPSPLARHMTADPPANTAQASADPWQVTRETQRAAVARSLRLGAAGCHVMDGRLSPGEQQLCDDRFNEAAGRAGPLGTRTLTASEARREARFARDGAAALAQYQARRRSLSGGVGIIGPGDCPGSNLGTGCAGAHLDPALRQGATTVVNPGLGSNKLDLMRPIPGQE